MYAAYTCLSYANNCFDDSNIFQSFHFAVTTARNDRSHHHARGSETVAHYMITGLHTYCNLHKNMCLDDEGLIPFYLMIQDKGHSLQRGLPSSGRNFSKAVDAIVKALGYMSTPYDPKFFVKWREGMPILVMFHSDDFRWCGPPDMIGEWDKLVAAFEASKYKVKDCTKEPFVGINEIGRAHV